VSFIFVDRILSFESGKKIHAIKNVSRSEELFYWLPNGQRVLSPAVVTEALAQAGSWLKMISTDFTKRPVLLADEHTTYHGVVQAGDLIDLEVEILDLDEDVVVTKSRASVRGKPMVVVNCCRGYLLPMEDFSDPIEVKRDFNNVFRPEFAGVSRVEPSELYLPPDPSTRLFNGLRFIDGLLEHRPHEKVVGYKNITASETYFHGHFPRKPVVPGVILLTFVGEVCQYLIRDPKSLPESDIAMIPTFVRNVRFRKFVEPGDQCVITAEVRSGDCRQDEEDIVIAATIIANDKRVMQAEFGFKVMNGAASRALASFHYAT